MRRMIPGRVVTFLVNRRVNVSTMKWKSSCHDRTQWSLGGLDDIFKRVSAKEINRSLLFSQEPPRRSRDTLFPLHRERHSRCRFLFRSPWNFSKFNLIKETTLETSRASFWRSYRAYARGQWHESDAMEILPSQASSINGIKSIH